MKRLCSGLLSVLLAICPVGLVAKVRVVASLPTLAALAKEVGGAHIQVACLSTPTEDPHFVDARPSLMLALNRADLLLANGADLEEGWLPTLRVGARNPRVAQGGGGYMEAAQSIVLMDVPVGKVDRSMGDVHPAGNPHFLNDPERLGQIAAALAGRLGQLDAANAAAFEAGAATLRERLAALHAAQKQRFAALPPSQRQVVVYHRSLTYLLAWLGLREVATLEPRPGVPPDPAHVAAVLTQMRAEHVPAILQEEYYPTRASQNVAKLAAARLIALPGGVRFTAGQGLVAYLEELTQSIYGALSPPP